jgi:hypothetical protein
MRTVRPALVIVAGWAAIVALMALCGCGSKAADGSSSTLRSAVPTATTAEQGRALQAAQKAIGDCLATHHSLKSIEACAVPPAEQAAFKACALAAANKVHITTRAGREQLYRVELPNCVVQAQAAATATPTAKKTP